MNLSSPTTQALLTIAIPTYNRATFLDLNLQKLASEVSALAEIQRKLINIHISDNASIDDTTDVIQRYRGMPVNQFDSVRNETNVGGDANIALCYQAVGTPYVWVMGDDDLILPGGLAKVLDCLAQQDIDVAYLGSYGYQEDYLKPPLFRLKRTGCKIYDDPLDFARRTSVRLTYISALIVRSGVPLAPHASLLSGKNLSQLGWTFELLIRGKRFAIIRDWIVAGKVENSGGYGFVQVFAINLQEVATAILHNKPRIIEIIRNGAILLYFPSAVMRALANKSVSSHDANFSEALRQTFGDNWRYRLFLHPLLALPFPLARVYHYVITAFIRTFSIWLI
ncbi:MAG TPA: glycosyltransferase family 2 protein [Burkholderiaceae bacterium]